MKKQKRRRNNFRQKGQASIEAILIATVLLSAGLAINQRVGQRQFLSRLVERPWTYISGMIENGIWETPERGRSIHPNHLDRHASPQGDIL